MKHGHTETNYKDDELIYKDIRYKYEYSIQTLYRTSYL